MSLVIRVQEAVLGAENAIRVHLVTLVLAKEITQRRNGRNCGENKKDDHKEEVKDKLRIKKKNEALEKQQQKTLQKG